MIHVLIDSWQKLPNELWILSNCFSFFYEK